VQKSTLDMAGSSRLEQIRASMAGEKLAAAPEPPAVTSGSGTGQKDASVARLDELRASMKNQQSTGDAASAG
jgi:hypothetical protein